MSDAVWQMDAVDCSGRALIALADPEGSRALFYCSANTANRARKCARLVDIAIRKWGYQPAVLEVDTQVICRDLYLRNLMRRRGIRVVTVPYRTFKAPLALSQHRQAGLV